MRKADIVNEVYETLGISKKESYEVIDLILTTVKETLQKEEDVKIAGFGNFTVRSKGARKGRNPRTGVEIGIDPRKVVTFKASPIFKDFVNGNGKSE